MLAADVLGHAHALVRLADLEHRGDYDHNMGDPRPASVIPEDRSMGAAILVRYFPSTGAPVFAPIIVENGETRNLQFAFARSQSNARKLALSTEM